MNSSKNDELRREWAELEAGGIPLEPLKYRVGLNLPRNNRSLSIKQIGYMTTNILFEMRNHAIGIVFDPYIVNVGQGKINIIAWHLELPWATTRFEWLPDPREIKAQYMSYSFPGTEMSFERQTVLNHRAQRTLRHGDTLEGLMLGVLYDPFPESIQHGTRFYVRLKLYDQFDGIHVGRFNTWVQRTSTFDKKMKQRKKVDLMKAA